MMNMEINMSKNDILDIYVKVFMTEEQKDFIMANIKEKTELGYISGSISFDFNVNNSQEELIECLMILKRMGMHEAKII